MDPKRLRAASALIAKIDSHLAKGNAPLAESLCRAVLDSDPENDAIWYKLGLIVLERKDFPEAIRIFRRLAKTHPDVYEIHLNLAMSCFYCGKRQQAVTAFAKAAKLRGLHDRLAPRKPARKVSVVMATFNRAHLLGRSLEMYKAQTLSDFEIIVIDDSSSDATYELVTSWQSRLDIKYLRPGKPADCPWRDAGSIINMGIRLAFGEVIVCTHPEVMPGTRALEEIHARCSDYCYVACKPYFLTPAQQRLIDTVDWRGNLLAVRGLPGFYEESSRGGQYAASAIERAAHFDEWVFAGMNRTTWRWFGGFTENPVWGACDLTFNIRRQFLGIRTVTPQDEATLCLHQNHDIEGVDVIAPRDIRKCYAEVPVYQSQESAQEGNLW